MLNIDPELRPTVADIICHPWMTSEDEASREELAEELRERKELRKTQEVDSRIIRYYRKH